MCGVDGSASKNFVMCTSCDIQTAYHSTDAKAAISWNTRADTGRLSELEAEVARLREALTVISAKPSPEPNRSNWEAIVWEHISFASSALEDQS